VPETLPNGSRDDLQLTKSESAVLATPSGPADSVSERPLKARHHAPPGPPDPPDPAVIAELTRQATSAVIASAVKFADLELGNLGSHGIELADSGWDLVSSIVLQTREGSLAWDPARCSLLQHLCAVVQWKGRRLLQQRRRERSLDEMLAGRQGDGSGEDAARNEATIEAALVLDRTLVTPLDKAYDRARLYARFERAMWKLVLARKDPEVTAAFEAWTTHHTLGEHEVARHTGLPLRRATRAVRILRSLTQRLPAALQDDIRELLT
jgi:hypothetical protein